MLLVRVTAKIKAFLSSFREKFEVTAQTKQGHDPAWRDFSTTYIIVVREECFEARQIQVLTQVNGLSLLRLRQ